MFIFPVQLTTSRIGNLTRLIHTLLYVMTIHTYIHRHFYFMREHSLVELTEHDDSAANIIVHSVCVCVCVCVFFPFILDFNGRTSRGHTGRR